MSSEDPFKLTFGPTVHDYAERDVILYALGVGAKREDLGFVYENAEDFATLPTFGVVPSFSTMMGTPFSDIIPNFNPVSLAFTAQEGNQDARWDNAALKQ